MWPGRSGLKRTVEHVRRYRHIVGVLMKYGFEEMGGSFGRLSVRARPGGGSRADSAVRRRSRPVRVRMALQELGPTFIKLGQLLSTRPDIVPPEYVEELEQLQDRVAPERFDAVRAEIESELGGKLEEVFERFDPVPLAAGSIAQVHRARTHDGREVVVKARRPGIVQTMLTECEILESLSGLYKTFFADEDLIDPERMVKEFTAALVREVDLDIERRNQQRFLRAFGNDETVRIPEVLADYCSESVLTMEYIDGIRPGNGERIDAAGLDRKLLAARGANFGLRQIFELGFFHCDPHPGNFFFLEGNVVAAIDFGQVARLTGQDRLLLRKLALAILDRDVPRMAAVAQRWEMLAETPSRQELVRDAEAMLEEYWHVPLKDISFRRTIADGFRLIRKHRIRPPAEFTMMLKSMMTIESFARSLDPSFDVVEHLRPYARRLHLQQLDPRRVLRDVRRGLRDAGEFFAGLPEDVNALVAKFREGKFQLRIHHEHLENLAHTLDKSSNRISFALIAAALLVGSSLLVGQDGMLLGILRLETLGVLGYVAAAVLGLWLVAGIVRSRRL